MRILVTGAAGFIGFHVAKALLARGDEVIGIDNLNEYYELKLKNARIKKLSGYKNFSFKKICISDRASINLLFMDEKIEKVIHLAAQAGVRYSIDMPEVYIESNVNGFFNIIESCCHNSIKHFVYASSSSVYGNSSVMPLNEKLQTDKPISLYAATKKTNEIMAHTYSHLYGLPVTGLRFFTVYGPWGRPDMAPFIFARAIKNGHEILVHNNGSHTRDFTYIDDAVDGITLALDSFPNEQKANNGAKSSHRVYNLGGGKSTELLYFISCIENEFGKTAKLKMVDYQMGDVVDTLADIKMARDELNYDPKVTIQHGISEFIKWFNFYEASVT